MFRYRDQIDNAWLVVREAVEASCLPLAKVSTRLIAQPHYDRHVICVYNRDWRNGVAIAATREILRDLGFVEELGSNATSRRFVACTGPLTNGIAAADIRRSGSLVSPGLRFVWLRS